MSESIASLRHKIASATELGSVVRTMKAMAASSIGQYENAVRSQDDYYRTVQLGLAACFRQNELIRDESPIAQTETGPNGVIVFGSDQGLVGEFNEVMVDFVIKTLAKLPGKTVVWSVGERIQSQLTETNLTAVESFVLPNSINAITSLVGQILIEMETQREKGAVSQVYLVHNRPESGAVYAPVIQQLLPLDKLWQHNLMKLQWPTKNLPEVINNSEETLRAFIREYLFVTIFRACAESLASENASRLAAMQRAEKNINELKVDLTRTFHRLRQQEIDEELFDVLSGFEVRSSS